MKTVFRVFAYLKRYPLLAVATLACSIAATLMVIGAIMNVFGCAIGIALYGAMGAAVATAATNVIWNAAMAIYIAKRLNMTAGLLFAWSLRRSATKWLP